MGLSRDEILKRDELPTREVPVPEWGDGVSVRVRCLTMRERMQFAKASAHAADPKNDEPGPDPTALVVALGAVDEGGARLFSVQDSDAIAELRGDVIDRIAGEVMELSGMTEKAEADAEGNSGTTPSGGSPSDSPETSAAQSENSLTD